MKNTVTNIEFQKRGLDLDNKLEKLLNRLKEIFEDNNWKALERKNVVQILELEEDLDEKWIKDALDELIKEGTLYEPRNNMLKFTNKDD